MDITATDHPDALPVDKICFIGAGYVGSLSGIVMAAKSPSVQVTVVDESVALIEAWNSDELPVSEPGLECVLFLDEAVALDETCICPRDQNDEEIRRYEGSVRLPNLKFSSNIDHAILEAQIIYLCVGTPLRSSQDSANTGLDTSNLEKACERIARVSTKSKIIVEKSTAPSGTVQLLNSLLESNAKSGIVFDVFACPEFMSQGTAIHDLLNPSRILIGCPVKLNISSSFENLFRLYSAWVDPERIFKMSAVSAELAKLASNSFLAQRISSINTIATICEGVGADIRDVALSIGLDPRIGPHALQAGIGYGGSCLPKDLLGLSHTAAVLGFEGIASYWESVDQINSYQKTRVTDLILDQLPQPLSACKVSILGFAFKPNTLDTRNTAAAAIINKMVQQDLSVSIYDPYVTSKQISRELDLFGLNPDTMDSKITIDSDLYHCCNGANMVFVHTDWDIFRLEGPIDWASIARRMRHPKLYYSKRDNLERHDSETLGFRAFKIGR